MEEEEAASLAAAASWQPRPFNDLKSIYNRTATEAPAELFRKDLISAMKLPDSEPLASDEYWVITDQWKQEWERGVQVPVNPDSLPEPSVIINQTKPLKAHQQFQMPKTKYIRITKDEHFHIDRHVLSTAPAKSEAACSYDLDETDIAWLKLLNGERAACGRNPITEEKLERVIERLELNCWDKIQTILRNEEGIGIEYDENVICDVCRSPDSEEGNEMVFCDSCNICVHQACYGITRIPDGQWLCGTCALSQRPECVLCPNKGGAMKATRSGQKWAHVSCALWIPEVSIGCVEKMEPITKVSSIPQSRWALICVLCRERVGACIQCSVKTCKTAYHVTCAFKHGLEMRAIIEDENADDGVKLRSYCEKHSKTSKKEKSICSGSEEDDNKRKKRKDMTSEEKNQARAARLHEIEAEFDKHVSIKDITIRLDVDNHALQYIYNYWKLKRRAGNNKPLLPPKSEDVDVLSHKQEQADLEKMKVFVQLRQDLERVRNLCYMVSRREKLSRTFFRMREQTFYKQVAVLDSSHTLSTSVVHAVMEANHGPTIYDRLYSHSDTEEHNDFESILERIAGIKAMDENVPEINGLLKSVKKENPYKRMYFNGSKRRGGSLYGSSASSDGAGGACSSSDEREFNSYKTHRIIHSSNNSSSAEDKPSLTPTPSKRKGRRSRLSKKRRKHLSPRNSNSTSSEDDISRKSHLQQVRDSLRSASESDRPSIICTDSDSSNASNSQNSSVRTKASVKEFHNKPSKTNPIPKSKPIYISSDLIVPQREAAKKASENMKSSTTSSRVVKDIVELPLVDTKTPPSPESKTKLKPKLTPKKMDIFDIENEKEDEILSYVPQRQAAKKATESMKSGLVKPTPIVSDTDKGMEPTVKQPAKIGEHKRKSSTNTNSSTSGSSSDSSDSSSTVSDKPQSDSLSGQTKRVTSTSKDWPFLDKGAKSEAGGSNDHVGTKKCPSPTRTKPLSRSSRSNNRDLDVGLRNITDSKPLEERGKNWKGKSDEVGESFKKEITKSNNVFTTFGKEDKRLNKYNLEHEVPDHKSHRDKTSSRAKTNLDRLFSSNRVKKKHTKKPENDEYLYKSNSSESEADAQKTSQVSRTFGSFPKSPDEIVSFASKTNFDKIDFLPQNRPDSPKKIETVFKHSHSVFAEALSKKHKHVSTSNERDRRTSSSYSERTSSEKHSKRDESHGFKFGKGSEKVSLDKHSTKHNRTSKDLHEKRDKHEKHGRSISPKVPFEKPGKNIVIPEKNAKLASKSSKILEKNRKLSSERTRTPERHFKLSSENTKMSEKNSKLSSERTRKLEDRLILHPETTKITETSHKLHLESTKTLEKNSKLPSGNNKILDKTSKSPEKIPKSPEKSSQLSKKHHMSDEMVKKEGLVNLRQSEVRLYKLPEIDQGVLNYRSSDKHKKSTERNDKLHKNVNRHKSPEKLSFESLSKHNSAQNFDTNATFLHDLPGMHHELPKVSETLPDLYLRQHEVYDDHQVPETHNTHTRLSKTHCETYENLTNAFEKDSSIPELYEKHTSIVDKYTDKCEEDARKLEKSTPLHEIDLHEQPNIFEKHMNLSEKEMNLSEKSTNLSEDYPNLLEKHINLHGQQMNISENTNSLSEKQMTVQEEYSNLFEKHLNLPEKPLNVSENPKNIHEKHANLPEKQIGLQNYTSIFEQMHLPEKLMDIPEKSQNLFEKYTHLPDKRMTINNYPNLHRKHMDLTEKSEQFSTNLSEKQTMLSENSPNLYNNQINMHGSYSHLHQKHINLPEKQITHKHINLSGNHVGKSENYQNSTDKQASLSEGYQSMTEQQIDFSEHFTNIPEKVHPLVHYPNIAEKQLKVPEKFENLHETQLHLSETYSNVPEKQLKLPKSFANLHKEVNVNPNYSNIPDKQVRIPETFTNLAENYLKSPEQQTNVCELQMNLHQNYQNIPECQTANLLERQSSVSENYQSLHDRPKGAHEKPMNLPEKNQNLPEVYSHLPYAYEELQEKSLEVYTKLPYMSENPLQLSEMHEKLGHITQKNLQLPDKQAQPHEQPSNIPDKHHEIYENLNVSEKHLNMFERFSEKQQLPEMYTGVSAATTLHHKHAELNDAESFEKQAYAFAMNQQNLQAMAFSELAELANNYTKPRTYTETFDKHEQTTVGLRELFQPITDDYKQMGNIENQASHKQSTNSVDKPPVFKEAGKNIVKPLSPLPTTKDSDLLDFDMLEDGFISKAPLSFSLGNVTLFKEDTKEDSARETLNLVEKLRMELSKKSTGSHDVDDDSSIITNNRNDTEDSRIEDVTNVIPNTTLQADERWVPPSGEYPLPTIPTPYLEQSSPSPYVNIHPQAKWADSEVMPARRSSSSSPVSNSSLCSQANEERPNVTVMNHQSLEMQLSGGAGAVHPLINPVSLFPPPVANFNNAQLPFPSPGAAMFPPTYHTLSKPVESTACAATFTSSEHNMALTAAMVNMETSPMVNLETSPTVNVGISPRSKASSKKSPSKPTRTSARFHNRSPDKSPRTVEVPKPSGPGRGRNVDKRRGVVRGRGRGRGRGRPVTIQQIYQEPDTNTINKLVGTVYDFDFDDDNDSMADLKSLRERRKSADVHASPTTLLKIVRTPPAVASPLPPPPPIVEPVLPGPVDMRTYSNFDDSQSYSNSNSNLLSTVDEEAFGKEPSIKASLSDSRNQLKVKIKGPIANYTSSVPVEAPISNTSISNTSSSIPSGGSSDTSNLRRMRKKELLRQYWTQENMDDSTTVPVIPAAPPINRTIITIPKAVASMTSIPTKEDYIDYRTGTDDVAEIKTPRKDNRARPGALSRELKQLDLPSGSGETTALERRKRGKQLAPKLKIKITGNPTVITDSVRPPKKRHSTIAQPNFENIKRENMKFRKMIMDDFGERKKKKDRSSKHHKRKNKHLLEIVANDGANPTKLIIRFNRKAPDSECENKKSAHEVVDGDDDKKTNVEVLKDSENNVRPIKLKISRCQAGSGYVMKSEESESCQPEPPLPLPLNKDCEVR